MIEEYFTNYELTAVANSLQFVYQCALLALFTVDFNKTNQEPDSRENKSISKI
jgi:hypothetical protein